MKLLKVKDIYVWYGDYSTKEIPKAANFKWNPTERRWETNVVENAILLKKFADSELQNEFDAYLKRYEDSSATDADIDIPVPDGLSYFGYQRAGISYAINNPNVLIGDEMGLGKTIQAIGVINAVKEIKRILIVCPASLKVNWKRELERWLVREFNIQIVGSTDKHRVNGDIFIVNYDILSRLSWLGSEKYDLIIADECHYLKNAKTRRSKSFADIREKSKRLILLTGTPILNRPIELWNLLVLLRFQMSFWQYVTRYCGASLDNGWDKSGATNLEELQVILRRSFMIRREKMQVLADLPSKTRQIVFLDSTKYKSLLDEEHRYLSTAGIQDDVGYNDGVTALKEPSAKHISEMAILRHHTALAKVDDVIEHVQVILELTKKVVVFAHHQDVIARLYAAFDGVAVALTGGMSGALKDLAVTEFQTNPKIRVFIGSIQAAGVGLTLTAANTVIFAELDWVPANITQAEDRCHRIGQFDNVHVFHVVVDGSIDAKLAKRTVAKQEIIDRATRKQRSDAYLESQYDHVELVQLKMTDNVAAAEEYVNISKTDSVTPESPIRLYTVAERENVQTRLVALNMMSGSSEIKPYDVRFVNQLANQTYLLTNRQCEVAIKILRKYQDQIGIIDL